MNLDEAANCLVLKDAAAFSLAGGLASGNARPAFQRIRVCPHTMLDEGIERCLDRVQTRPGSTRSWSIATLSTHVRNYGDVLLRERSLTVAALIRVARVSEDSGYVTELPK